MALSFSIAAYSPKKIDNGYFVVINTTASLNQRMRAKTMRWYFLLSDWHFKKIIIACTLDVMKKQMGI